MIERLAMLLLIAALLSLGWHGLRWRSLRLARAAPLPPEAVQALAGANTAILYFWTASCAQCRSLQTPALRQLERELHPAVAVVPIDAAARSELSARFGIITVPATVIIDQGGVRSVNLGYTSAAVLREQLNRATPTQL
ncbi:MAG: thiol reductase thioredoxin [Herpetosiphonaceae bacterium]|nr:MAG: thiol reductase thioredoxin [Herpetosiphonaceae bacterium]